jgi:prepilin-type processing-associated H-X9-DG protein
LPYYNDADSYWGYSGSIVRVLGYVFATPGVPGVEPFYSVFTSPPPKWTFIPQVATNYSMANPENLAYIVDTTLSVGTNPNRDLNQYSGIVGAAWQQPHQSAHMRGNMTEGGNLMMLDGHVEWRRFEKMMVRNSDVADSQPAFWW